MSLHQVSSYRLCFKSTVLGAKYDAPNGVCFAIFASENSEKFAQFYVVDSSWAEKKNEDPITPLAQIQVSQKSGNIKMVAFQPEHWGIELDSKDFLLQIKPMLLNSNQ